MKFGLYIKSLSSRNIEVIGLSGIDFVVLDMEHTPITYSELYQAKLACEINGLDAIVRLPIKGEEYFKWVLDLGFDKVQIPHTETINDVKKAHNFSSFYPKGNRGLCKFVRSADYSVKNVTEYIHETNKNTEVIFQIEGNSAFLNIDEILNSLNSSDSIFIGPYDLSQSLGCPGQVWSEKVLKTMDVIIDKCKKNNVCIGTFTDSEDGIKYWKNKGIDFLQYASDLRLLHDECVRLSSI